MQVNDDALRAAFESKFKGKGFEGVELKRTDGGYLLMSAHQAWQWFQEGVNFFIAALPSDSPMSDKPACVSESAESERQTAIPGPAQEGESAEAFKVFHAMRSAAQQAEPSFIKGVEHNYKLPRDRVAQQSESGEGDSINPSVSAAPSHVDDKNVGGVPGEEGLVEAIARAIYDWGIPDIRGTEDGDVDLPWKEALDGGYGQAGNSVCYAEAALSIARPALERPLRERIAELEKSNALYGLMANEVDTLFAEAEDDAMTLIQAQNENIDLRRQLGEMREALKKCGVHTYDCAKWVSCEKETSLPPWFSASQPCTCGLEKALRGEGGS